MNPYKLFELCEKLNTELLEAKAEINRLTKIIADTIEENLHLADGENCTLFGLKKALAERKP